MHVSPTRSAAAEGGPALDIGGIDHVAITLDVAVLAAEDDEQAPIAAAAAKSYAGDVAVAACERAIQVLGGIGFTWEHVLHRYYKRAQWIDAFEGFGHEHRADVARELLDVQAAAAVA